MTIIVGLEGVLARHEWRTSLIESEGWPAYHEAASKDAANLPMVQLIAAMRAKGSAVYCISSRPEAWRSATVKWMTLHGVMVDVLLLRGEKDFRSDIELRTEAVSGIVKVAKEVLLAIDESEKACDVYRAAGITTLQLTNPSNGEVT